MANNSEKIKKTIKAVLVGTISESPVPEKVIFPEKKGFQRFEVSCKRRSGTADRIRVIVSSKIFREFKGSCEKGSRVRLDGKFCSKNIGGADGKRHLILYFHPDRILPDMDGEDRNYLEMFCTTCKMPAYRFTPMGKDITDLVLAVNWKKHEGDKKTESTYTPSICWGDVALAVSEYPVGTFLHTRGYMQSREYIKDGVSHTVMEYSIFSVREAEELLVKP